ncbi:MAG: M36 family metallopeptidase [Chitinophagaceae bacterium]
MSHHYKKLLVGLATGLLLFNSVKAQEMDFAAAKTLILKNAGRIGITSADVNEAVVTDAYTDPSSKISFVYLQQAYKQIKVYNTIITCAFRDGSFLYSSGNFVQALATKAGSITPAIPYMDAIKVTALHLGLSTTAPLVTVSDLFATEKKYSVAATAIANRNIDVTLVFTPSGDKQQMTLTWNVNIDVKGSADWYNVRINALNGDFVQEDNWTVDEKNAVNNSVVPIPGNIQAPVENEQVSPVKKIEKGNGQNTEKNPAPSIPPIFLNAATVTNANYRVVPFPLESLNFGAIATVNKPWLLAGAGNNATTNGWHYDGATNYNITRGNNVFAYLDVAAPLNSSNAATNWPDTSTTPDPSLAFDNTPIFNQQPGSSANNVNKKFAVDNLFYWNNLMHDVFYQYGLNEVSGAFQDDNLSRGGTGNDHVNAQAMDGAGYNNANFSTPVDGSSGRMRMYLWSGTPPCTINSPEAIAGPVLAAEAGFTTTVPSKLINTGPKTGNVIWYTDAFGGSGHTGCGVATNAAAIAGNIALIDAFGGTGCTTYAFKVKNAQNAGAVAVIVYSSTATPLNIGGTDATAATIAIPVISIPNSVGVSISNQLTLGNPVNFTMTSGIYLDGDIDNGIVAHEYGHGISNRLTGGPANSSCLGNAEQGGEGWSDYMALMMTTNWATANLTDGLLSRPVGTYAYNQPANGIGIRRYPFSTKLLIDPLTYADMAASTEVHNIGEIWCSALWDMTWNIITQQGAITSNLYNAGGPGGNVIALNLVTMGMKFQPCTPGFLDARNAILAADSILYGYAHKCAIWDAFARRGMGYSALQGLSTSATDQTPAFDLPAGLQVSRPLPTVVSINSQTAFTHTATCGCAPITGYVVRDTIPSGFSYVTSSPLGTVNGNVLSFPASDFTASQSKNFTITLQAPATGCLVDSVLNDNRETKTVGGFATSGAPGWSASTVKSHTPASSWFASDPAAISSSSLTSANTAMTGAQNLSILSFWHTFNTEIRYDGGVVEYSTDGSTWIDASPFFYNYIYNTQMDASTVLTGRKAFSGNNAAFTPSLLNVTSLGTTPVAFRFRMESDNGGSGDGWFVDDIIRANGCGGILKTGIYNSGGVRQDTLLQPVFVTTATLPLTLLWFYSGQVGNQVALNWKTVSEYNVRDFTIEWSADGNRWSNIGSSRALNGSSNSYDFIHATPVNGNNYYRIKMNDADGHFTYSPVRTVNMLDKKKPMVSLVPNPVTTDAMLYISKEVNARSVKIYNAAGGLVQKVETSNMQQLQISTANLPAGVYTIETNGKGRYVTRMIVKH